jgi:hypothetical protein
MSQPPKKKKSKNRKRKGKGKGVLMSQNSGPANQLSSIPAAIGYIANQNTFSISNLVQREADQDWKNGVRCSGSALLNTGLQSYSTSYANTYPNGYTSALASLSKVGQGWAYLAPNEIDPRLSALVSCYQYYAFRRLCLKYIPAVGSNANGTIFVAISKDPEEAVSNYTNIGGSSTSPGTGTIQQVMDTDPSVATTIWQPAQVEFIHRGVKLWETFGNSEEPVVARLQAAIVALFQGTAPSGSTPTSFFYGNLYLDYDIDLYVPGPPLAVN